MQETNKATRENNDGVEDHMFLIAALTRVY